MIPDSKKNSCSILLRYDLCIFLFSLLPGLHLTFRIQQCVVCMQLDFDILEITEPTVHFVPQLMDLILNRFIL